MPHTDTSRVDWDVPQVSCGQMLATQYAVSQAAGTRVAAREGRRRRTPQATEGLFERRLLSCGSWGMKTRCPFFESPWGGTGVHCLSIRGLERIPIEWALCPPSAWFIWEFPLGGPGPLLSPVPWGWGISNLSLLHVLGGGLGSPANWQH